MTITATDFVQTVDGGGLTQFNYPYPFDRPADLRLMTVAADGTRDEPAYSVSGTPDGGIYLGATFTTEEPVPSGTTVVMWRETSQTQLIDYQAGNFPSAAHERAADRLVMLAQEFRRTSERSLRTDYFGADLDPLAPVPGGVVFFDPDTGQPRSDGPTTGDIENAAANAALAKAWAEGSNPDGSGAKSAREWAEVAAYIQATLLDHIGAAATRAAAQAATVPTGVDTLQLTHNGLSLSYVRDASGTALTTGGGAKWSPNPALPVWLEHWGVAPVASSASATTDYTSAVQAAVAWTQGDLLISGWVKITDKIDLNTSCRLHSVRGREGGGFAVAADFNLSADYVLGIPTTVDGVEVGALGIAFEQAAALASGSRGDLVAYPPALDISKGTRTILGEVRIVRGIDGVMADGNAGGSRFGTLELGCFGDNVYFDGALDFVHVESVEVWPYGIAGTGLADIFYDGNTRALFLGRVDGWHCDKFSAYKSYVEIDPDNNSLFPMSFGALQLDGDKARLLAKAGHVHFDNLSTSKTSTPTDPSIAISGANVHVGSLFTGGAEAVQVKVTAGSFYADGGVLYNNDLGKRGAVVSGGVLAMRNLRTRWPTGARTVPLIEQSGTGVLVLGGCTAPGGVPTAEVVKIGADNAGNFVDARSLGPHGTTLPASIAKGRYLLPRQSGQVSVSFATPGDLSVSYGIRTAYWQLDGDVLHLNLRVTFTATFSTASGALGLTIDGFPTLAQFSELAVAQFLGLNLGAGYTGVVLRARPAGLDFLRFGSGVAATALNAAQLTSGQGVQLMLSGTVRVL